MSSSRHLGAVVVEKVRLYSWLVGAPSAAAVLHRVVLLVPSLRLHVVSVGEDQ